MIGKNKSADREGGEDRIFHRVSVSVDVIVVRACVCCCCCYCFCCAAVISSCFVVHFCAVHFENICTKTATNPHTHTHTLAESAQPKESQAAGGDY